MSEAPDRPRGTRLLAPAAILLGFALAIVVIVALSANHPAAGRRVVTITTPAPLAAVIGTKPPPPTLTAAGLAQARKVARAFLASYLPVLYSRRPASTIVDADARLRAELAAATRAPRAPRKRRPRVTALRTHVQNTRTILALATVDDTVSRPYQIALQLTRGRRWVVTQLANY